MIIIDYSQVVISTLMAEIGSRTDVEIEVDLLRHMIINNIRSHKVKFHREFGDIVIACDSKKYWRKQAFPYYKANRKKAREDSGFNWPFIFDAINLIKEELKTFFPYKVIEVEGAEADDVIASIVKWSVEHDVKEHALFQEPNPTIIISGDHDFIQLQKYKHVKQFSPVQKNSLNQIQRRREMYWNILSKEIRETEYQTSLQQTMQLLEERGSVRFHRKS